jgi:hypothetical protein
MRACSSSVVSDGLAHVSVATYPAFASDMLDRRCDAPVDPTLTARPSVNARRCSWHVAQACVPLPDKRVS